MTDTWSGFGSLSYETLPGLTITGSLRYSTVDKTGSGNAVIGSSSAFPSPENFVPGPASVQPSLSAAVGQSVLVGARQVTTAVGLAIGIGEIVAGLTGPLLGGVLADRYGLLATLWLQAALLTLIVVSVAFPARDRTAAPYGVRRSLGAGA